MDLAALLALALAANPRVFQDILGYFRGAQQVRPQVARGPVGPVGVETPMGFYGHRAGVFTVPGAGGGAVAVPNLTAAAQAGDPFAQAVLARQAESAQRSATIDRLLAEMMAQAPGEYVPTRRGPF